MSTLDRSVEPAPGPIRDYRFPPVDSVTLSNGVRSLVCRAGGLPLITAQVVIDAGAACENREQAGIATLTASALEGGSRDRTGLELAWSLEDLGLELATWSSWDGTHVRVTATTQRIGPALNLLCDIVRNPAFPPSELERLRTEHIGEIMQRETDPRALADDTAPRVFYAEGSTYQRPLYGYANTVEHITVDDVRAFHAAHFQPSTTSVILVGDIDPAAGHELVQRAFGDWAATQEPPSCVPRGAPAHGRTVHLVDRPGSVQSELRIGHRGVPRSNPDHFPLLVANGILGGAFTSRLNLSLREKHGFTYGVRSGFAFRRGAGPFIIQTAVATDVTARALEETFREVRNLTQDGVTEDEVRNAANYLAGVFPLQLQTTEELAQRISEIVLYDLAVDYFQTYRDCILAVTPAQIGDAVTRNIRPDEFVVVVVGDASAVRDEIAALDIGAVSILDDDASIPVSPS